MNKKITLILTLFLLFNLLNLNAQVVTIADQNGNTNTSQSPQINIDCNYLFVPPKKVQLTATFPEIKNPTSYVVAPISYVPVGLFSAGNPITITGDDVWSTNIPIGFPFCFYGNNYSTLNVADNGIVRFGYNSSVIEGGFSAITNTIPSPSLIKNSIFAGFQDYILTSGLLGNLGCTISDNCGTITYYTSGTAPFQRMIINYNLINHFGCSSNLNPINTTKSTFQIVLYETTNIIEIYVKDKPLTCQGNFDINNGITNSLIGLNDSTGSPLGIAAPNRNTSNWAATDEAYRFTPNGSSTTTVEWFENGLSLGVLNPIEVIPTVNTSYTAKVRYATCTPKMIESTINVAFDPTYPVAPNITKKYCDNAAPFPNQTAIDVEALLVDATDLVGTIKTIYFTQNEANAGTPLATPILGLNNYTMTTATQIFYYREDVGSCFITGKITLSLFETPQITNLTLDVCDAGNDGTENVNLAGLTSRITGFNTSTMGIGYYQNAVNANLGGSNTISNVPLTTAISPFDVYIRVYNLLNPDCWSVSTLTIRLLPNLILNPVTTFCVPDPDFDGNVSYNLNTIPVVNGNFPVANPTFTYYSSLSNAQSESNPINALNYTFAIQPAPAFTTIYIVGNAVGYCKGITSVNITICVPTGNGGDGGNGGNGGFGGAGFAACIDAANPIPIPSFNLEALFNVVIAVLPLPTPTGYYSTLIGAQTQDPLVQLTALEVANFVPTPLFSLIWVRYIDANNIVGIKRLVIPVKFFKTQQVITKEICDVYNDSKQIINLSPTSVYIQEIQALNPGETITCYPTQTDYDNNINAIVAPYNFQLDFTNNPIEDTVYIRVSSYGCDSDYKLVFTLKPFAIPVPKIEKICDIAPFGNEPYPNLQTLVNDIKPDYSLTFTFSIHSTLNGAFDNTAIIFNTLNYPINLLPATSVFIRITENPLVDPAACPTIQEIKFGFFDSVLVNPNLPINVCDTDNDNKVIISNLNAYVASIISVANVNLIFPKLFTTKLAAENNTFTFEILPNWDTFEYNLNAFIPFSNSNSIWLRLENSVTGCSRIIEIQLIMQSVVLPVLNNPLTICDYKNDNTETIANFNIFNTQVVLSSFLYNFQYFLSEAEAISGTSIIPANYPLANNTTIWVKITTSANSTCSKIKDYLVTFTQSPIVNDIQPKICDDLANNIETKNLSLYLAGVIAPAAYTYQYYLSEANAITGSNQQPATYNMTFAANNLAAPIFVKVINSTGCYGIAKILFERETIIEAFDEQIFTCDVSLDNTLQGFFDLTSKINRTGISGMIINPANYTISYHTTIPTTAIQVSDIATPTNFQVLTNQTSYVYVRFIDINGCFTVKQIELQIYNLPKFKSGEIFICDDDLDGIYSQDLNVLKFEVVLNPAPFTFGYFNSYNDAFTNTDAITNLTNYSVALSDFPKSIFVKGTNSNNCSKIREVILRHKPEIVLLTANAKLLKCDADNNGIEIFNLTDANLQLSTQVGVTFKYYVSFSDAQANNSNFITNTTSYTNLTNGQEVFVRISKSDTNCDSWAKIKLNAFYEQYNFPISETLCDNNNDGTETINLQQIVLGYIAPLTLLTNDLKFYTDIADGNVGTAVGLIPNPTTYNFINLSTDIYVRITNILTDCPIVKKINFVVPSPIIIIDVEKNICDLDSNNSETINLSDYFQSMSIPIISNFTITSYLTEPNANAGTIAISSTSYLQIIPNQTYWIRFEDAKGCYSVKSVKVQIIPLATPTSPQNPIILCDNFTPNLLSEEFNLLTNFPFGVTNPNDYNFTYHTSLLNAQNNVGAISAINLDNYDSNSTSIWVRIISKVSNALATCAKYVEQPLILVPLATPTSPQNPIILCDNLTPNLLSEEFNLLTNFPFGVTNPNNYNFTYHTSLLNAQNNIGAISAINLDNYDSNSTSIWVRIISKVSNAIATCAKYVEQPLILVPLATPTSPQNPIILCDNITPNLLSEEFNLLTNFPFGVTNPNDYNFTYHTSLLNAQNNIGAISAIDIDNYDSNSTSIWVRIISKVSNAIATCAKYVEQPLILVPLATPTSPQNPIILCDNFTPNLLSEEFNLLTNFPFGVTNPNDYNFTYHTSLLNAQNNVGAISAINLDNYDSNSTSIWVRIISKVSNALATCAKYVEQPLILVPLATPTSPQNPIILCDNLTPNLSSEEFNLLTNFPFGVTNPNNYNFTYHTSLLNAQNNIGVISAINLDNYDSNSNSIWVRIISKVSNAIATCAKYVEQPLILVPLATPTSPQNPIILCDNFTPNLLSEEFNLLTNFPFGVTNPNDYNFTYHTSLLNAQNNVGAISAINLDNYDSNSTSIWVRIISKVSNAIATCAKYVEQPLILVPLATPTSPQNPIILCDNLSPNLSSEEFNLLTNFPFGVTNPNNYNFTYHTSLLNAQNNIGAIPAIDIDNYDSNSTSIWVRIISKVSNALATCAKYVEQPLFLNPLPTPRLNPSVIKLCDDLSSGDLKEIFNLATNELFIRNGNSSYLITYFKTKLAAENNIIADQILNFGSYFSPTDSVWIRITTSPAPNSIIETCAIVIEQKLQVNPLPLAGPINNLNSCINAGTSQATFDLNSRKTAALAGQNANDFSVTFHLLEAEAKIGSNLLQSSYLSNTKIIYAGVKNNLTGCRNTSPLQIIAETTTTATQPNTNFTLVCDTESLNDGFTKFKLSDMNAVILGTQSSANYSINYYANQQDLNTNIPLNQLDYTNISNPQTIIANVINMSSNVFPKKCAAQIDIVLKVNLIPETNPKDGFVCYDQTTGELLTSYTIESELSNADHSFEWFLNTNSIPISGETSSTLTVPNVGNYTVIATQKAYPNCKSVPKKITVTKSEPALAIARVEYSFTENLNVITIATGLGNYVYQLDENEIQTSNLFENVEPGTHKIIVIDKNGCEDYILSVIVLDYVRYFTPNDDNFNDKWNIKGIKDQPNAKVYIYDRYGKFLKQVTPGEVGWDGTFAGNIMPSDDYWFTVSYEENGDQKEFKSHFAMKR